MLKKLAQRIRSEIAARKTLIASCLATLCLCASVVQSPAQIIYGGIMQTGLVAQPVMTAFAVTSNSVTLPVTQHYLMVTNIQTNFNYVVSYGTLLVGQSGSNFVQQVTLTTNLSAALGFTNGGTWIYTVPAQYLTPYATPWASILLPPTNGMTPPFTSWATFQ